MLLKNPYSNYSNNKIFTASKEELTLMLYEGALKFANQAIIALENKDMEKTNTLIVRVQDIIREFQITLNRSYPISEKLYNLYDYLYRRLIEGNMKKDKEILSEVRDFLRDFRDLWKEAMVLAKNQNKEPLSKEPIAKA
ncbi:MAG: flagellar export chaperone FliS [Defluviitaleaceae bacterium]|nr:flagellar export chaperone FliS [Defluviitaleaceae bacterium]